MISLTFLQVLYNGTHFFSRSYPTLSEVLLAIDTINEFLTTHSIDVSLQAMIPATVNLPQSMLSNCYE